MLRSCARCGDEFVPSGHASVCFKCKIPRLPYAARVVDIAGQPLSFRQTQITKMVALGKSNKEIAYGLHLGTGTIKVYMMTIFRKAAVTNRTELAVWWLTRATRATR